MMKSSIPMILLASTLSLANAPAHAEDYSNYTNEQMIEMSSSVQSMSESERNAYRTEMQARVQSMDANERDALRSSMAASTSGQGSMSKSRLRDGSGGGQKRGDGHR